MTKKLHNFIFRIEKNGDTLVADLNYVVASTQDETMKKNAHIRVKSDNEKLVQLVEMIEGIIKNKESIV